jgi:hypothetical protein
LRVSTNFGPLNRDFRFPLNILDREPRFASQQNWSLVSETCQKGCPRDVRLTPDSDRTADIASSYGLSFCRCSRRLRYLSLAASHRLVDLEPLELWVVQIQRKTLVVPLLSPTRLQHHAERL